MRLAGRLGRPLRLLLGLFLAAASARSSDTPRGATYLIEHLPCAQQVFDALDHWETPILWHRFVTADSSGTHLASPTDEIGTWIYLNVDTQRVTATRRTEFSDMTISWNTNGCASEATLTRIPSTEYPEGRGFSNGDLIRLLEKSKENHLPGVIYTWSPHMPLSILGLKEIMNTSKRLGFELTVVLDPSASLETAQRVAKNNGFPDSFLKKARSTELIQRNILYHYPSYTYFRDGKLLGLARPGYDAPKRLEGQVREKLLQ